MNDYYTVSQYAELTGKDTGNLRRMLIDGRLKGEKIGNQWVIPKDTVCPPDNRVKTGKYHNSRRVASFRQTNPKLMEQLKSMSRDLSKLYGSKLDSIVVYGSYSRGEETPESDVDIAIILNDEMDEATHEAMTDLIVDYELELGVVLSVVPIDINEYNQWKRVLPFYKNIKKEGIVIWKAE